MELSKSLLDAINRHINAELNSAYQYLSISAYCESIDMPGFAHWFRAQHNEELDHGLKLFDFVNDRGGQVKLKAINEPTFDFKSLMDAVQQTLANEREVTSMIHRLYEQSVEESDYATQVMLQWFISEQVEEEKTVNEILEQLKLVGDDDGAGLLMIDDRLGKRTSS